MFVPFIGYSNLISIPYPASSQYPFFSSKGNNLPFSAEKTCFVL